MFPFCVIIFCHIKICKTSLSLYSEICVLLLATELPCRYISLWSPRLLHSTRSNSILNPANVASKKNPVFSSLKQKKKKVTTTKEKNLPDKKKCPVKPRWWPHSNLFCCYCSILAAFSPWWLNRIENIVAFYKYRCSKTTMSVHAANAH